MSKVISVEAISKDEAIDCLKQLYDNDEIRLDADDFVDGDFKILTEE